ncbi:hypothetical protein DPMN_004756 [Dreissena polymorpha]|uniref:Major facilitator superfamily (MFS) profile domain-containing protein n=1 Tax=Dreissena polymorpha TaxID=45954 RepID=A0A9D4MRW9_DREPO|nr:hypothetical protein DPMN_004747 [Dreissena polymorpha]KAH3880834.1 hypothetical protein DPMN_004756 [Dreissena polymorpha]
MDANRQNKGRNGRTRPKKLYDGVDDEKLDLKIDSIKEKVKTPCIVYILTFFSTLGGFTFGYDTSVISGASIFLKKEFGLTIVWQELVVSVMLATAAIFALVGGMLNSKLGRRGVILVSCAVFVCAAILMGISVDKYMLLAGRLLAGAAIGEFTITRYMYSTSVQSV